MFGIFFAGLCAVGLYRLWRPRHYGHHAYAMHGGCGPRHGWHGRSPRLYRLMGAIKATPEQDDAIRQSAREVFDAWRSAQSPQAFAGPVAAALTAETFDANTFATGQADTFRTAVAKAIERLRSTLDAEQRRELADMLTSRFGGWGC